MWRFGGHAVISCSAVFAVLLESIQWPCYRVWPCCHISGHDMCLCVITSVLGQV